MRTLFILSLLGVASAAAAQAPASHMTRADDPAPTAAQAERDAKIRAALAKADTDKNQRYTRAEWLAAGRKAANFDATDTNKDGVVTAEEIRTAAVALDARRDKEASATDHSKRAEQARESLAKADANGDKRYSRTEWIAAGRQARQFDALDTNKDGFVTGEEIRAGAVAATAARKPAAAKH